LVEGKWAPYVAWLEGAWREGANFDNAFNQAIALGRMTLLAEYLDSTQPLTAYHRARLAGFVRSLEKRPRGRPRNITKVPAKDPGIAKHEIVRTAEHNAAIRYGQLLQTYRREHNCKQVPGEEKQWALTQAQDDACQSFGVRPDPDRIRRLVEKGDRPLSMHRAHKIA
jgi:hypothetical protein